MHLGELNYANRNLSTDYPATSQLSDHQVLEQAAEIIANKYLRGDVLSSPEATKEFLTYKLGNYEREVFAVLMLDNQHRLIEFKELFFGTIDAASVYPREVVKLSLETNAAAVIFAHNHPSGVSEPSQTDRRITSRLKDALALVVMVISYEGYFCSRNKDIDNAVARE